MCQCTPNLRTPFCGKLGCESPHQARQRACLESLGLAGSEKTPELTEYDMDFICQASNTLISHGFVGNTALLNDLFSLGSFHRQRAYDAGIQAALDRINSIPRTPR